MQLFMFKRRFFKKLKIPGTNYPQKLCFTFEMFCKCRYRLQGIRQAKNYEIQHRWFNLKS